MTLTNNKNEEESLDKDSLFRYSKEENKLTICLKLDICQDILNKVNNDDDNDTLNYVKTELSKICKDNDKIENVELLIPYHDSSEKNNYITSVEAAIYELLKNYKIKVFTRGVDTGTDKGSNFNNHKKSGKNIFEFFLSFIRHNHELEEINLKKYAQFEVRGNAQSEDRDRLLKEFLTCLNDKNKINLDKVVFINNSLTHYLDSINDNQPYIKLIEKLVDNGTEVDFGEYKFKNKNGSFGSASFKKPEEKRSCKNSSSKNIITDKEEVIDITLEKQDCTIDEMLSLSGSIAKKLYKLNKKSQYDDTLAAEVKDFIDKLEKATEQYNEKWLQDLPPKERKKFKDNLYKLYMNTTSISNDLKWAKGKENIHTNRINRLLKWCYNSLTSWFKDTDISHISAIQENIKNISKPKP